MSSITRYDVFCNQHLNKGKDSIVGFGSKGVFFEKKTKSSIIRFVKHFLFDTEYIIEDCLKQAIEFYEKRVRVIERLDRKKTASFQKHVRKGLAIIQIADYVYQRREPIIRVCELKKLRELRNKFLQKIELLGGILSQREQKSIPLIYCEEGGFDIALESLLNQPIPDDIQPFITELFFTAWYKKKKKLTLEFLKKGITIEDLAGIEKKLLFLAIQEEDEHAGVELIKKGVDPFIRSKQGVPVVHDLIHKKLFRVFQAVFEKEKRDIFSLRDNDGNTLLHVACSECQFRFVQQFPKEYIDYTIMNNKGVYPFQMAIGHQKKEDALQFYKELFSSFDVNLVDCWPVENEGDIVLGYDESILKGKSEDLLELAFLLQDMSLAKKVVATTSKKKTSIEIKRLQEKYKASQFDRMHFLRYCIKKEHIQVERFFPELKELKETVPLSTIVDFFDEIDFHNRESSFFIDPEDLVVDTGTQDPGILREMLVSLIENTEKRIAFMGTPRQDDVYALDLFYAKITLLLQHVITTIQCMECDEIEKKTQCIKETITGLLQASGRCGGRYYYVAVALYHKIACQFELTFEEKILLELVPFRENILMYAIHKNQKDLGQRYAHDFHDYMVAVKQIGSLVGVPGGAIIGSFQDPYNGFIKEQEIISIFFSLYNPYSIAKNWISVRFKEDSYIREAFVDWCKTHVPKKWKSSISDPETPREYAYLYEEVFDVNTGEIRIEAILYMLESIGVLEETIKQSRWSAIEQEIGAIFRVVAAGAKNIWNTFV